MTGHEYCDCDSGSDIPLVCPPDELFCDAIGEFKLQNVHKFHAQKKALFLEPFLGDCVHIFGQECSDTDYCCAGDKPTTTTTTTAKPDKSCRYVSLKHWSST